ncbi:unnamed protein product [Triticum turgidum subsp. durum]|uniref:RING-type domain-containing protein n=1 Tax=Triticum turgidum subsp. durum TaxID=4567 RepID=A0A9R1RYG3_TRITD|nr:unnamed protein product [Triticum turgidum subsp. durum]
MPPPLKDMLPPAAAATECRLTGLGTIKRRTNQSKRHPCTVRVHGHLTVVYGLLELGGSRTSRPLHHLQVQYDEDAPRSFDRTFLLNDPRTFFRSRSACRDGINQMLTRTPALRDFDLAAANWDGGFLPDDLAGTITGRARLDEEGHHGGNAPRFSLDLSLTVFVRAVCSEAKLLALACREATAQCGLSVADRCCCCICQDQDIAAAEGGGDDEGTVRLPCSHTFHVRWLARWFEAVTTCPLCRRDMVVHLEAVYTHDREQGRNRETKGPIQV